MVFPENSGCGVNPLNHRSETSYAQHIFWCDDCVDAVGNTYTQSRAKGCFFYFRPMLPSDHPTLQVRFAREHNLQDVSVEIPHHRLVVVTGVSGSGKSSLAFDVVAREGQRRYLETFPAFSRQFMGKLARPEVEEVRGLSPVITVGQKTVGANARSTVGTMSDLYDLLRLLYARIGKTEDEQKLTRSLFSFNTPQGACSSCHGLGVEEKISIDKLVADGAKTLREGALAPTLPTGYIMYSQVTVDVLNQVCEAHGFDVDTPWLDLTEEQRKVVLYGSDKLKVPFGKHSLESRLKWTGIVAKPREEGYYKGMMPIMTDILRRDRNKNILRYAESVQCEACQGKRLNERALNVKLGGEGIDALAAMEITDLQRWLEAQSWSVSEEGVARQVVQRMSKRIDWLKRLGVGYLSLDRPAATLSGGESQRIRLVNQVAAALSNVLYVFDEPSIGLHPADNEAMIAVLRQLVAQGNSVMVVEHDEATIRQADWIVDIGPRAGVEGGKLLYNGTMSDFLKADLKGKSPTWDALQNPERHQLNDKKEKTDAAVIRLHGVHHHNLKHVDVQFRTAAFNVVSGVSGAGKSSLVHGVLQPTVETGSGDGIALERAEGLGCFDQVISISQKPIGRTPRSNPATYTGLADQLRDVFARLPEAKALGLKKSHFSFNTKGGRCETCHGAGRTQVGMHFLGNVDVLCGTCEGKRFNDSVLQVKYGGKSIAEVLELTVRASLDFFAGEAGLQKHLQTLSDVGLGYLTLGQPSTTLSGGEAQRIKLASELHKTSKGPTLYLLDEPTIGLHLSDITVLLKALRRLITQGNTVICIEHDADVIRQADWVVDLGPDRGSKGGEVVVMGTPADVAKAQRSKTGQVMQAIDASGAVSTDVFIPDVIRLEGVTTHRLKQVNVEIPKGVLTVITGVSGSGKSSLAFDTLFAEAQSRFTESMSTYARSLLQQSNQAEIENSEGLGPVIAIGRKYLTKSRRSTVGTLTGLNDHYRLLYSRLAQLEGQPLSTSHFSFNHQLGACPTCDGLGAVRTCDPEALITHPEQSILDGAMAGSKPGRYYGDPHGQFVATLKEIGRHLDLNFDQPWQTLPSKEKQVALYGTGERIWDFTWEFKNKTRTGTQDLKTTWPGLCQLVDDEYLRKQHNKNIEALEALLHDQPCATCHGSRLKSEVESIEWGGVTLPALSEMTTGEALHHLQQTTLKNAAAQAVVNAIAPAVKTVLQTMQELGLDYLTAARSALTLSGGEAQRVRLTSQFAANLYGVTYVLDEPTIGLHEDDTTALLASLKRLIAGGNTVVVVEHDETVIRAADYLIEMGPGAGHRGGNVIASGSLAELTASPASVTGPYLHDGFVVAPSSHQIKPAVFGVKGAHQNNLKNIDVDFAAHGLVAITGKSGSGKSTLMHQVLWTSVQAGRAVGCESIYGLDQFDRLLAVDQSPMSRNALSTPATYLGLMDSLRKYFAGTAEAKSAGLKKSAFSYHHKDGKCPECNGHGSQKTAMDFMGDVQTVCESCHGLRYNPSVLQCYYHDKNIGEVLQLTVDEAVAFFGEAAETQKYLSELQSVGLGHLPLGQAGNTLSGGESQRLKLAHELVHHRKGGNLYLFDEPSTGLHFKDIETLIVLYRAMVAEGHTVLYIEHHPALIAAADQVVTLGPVGGPEGGKLLS